MTKKKERKMIREDIHLERKSERAFISKTL